MCKLFFIGHFTVKETTRKFSNTAIDRAQKQNSEFFKTDGEAVGILEPPRTSKSVAGHEIPYMFKEFDYDLSIPSLRMNLKMHIYTMKIPMHTTKGSERICASFIRKSKVVVMHFKKIGKSLKTSTISASCPLHPVHLSEILQELAHKHMINIVKRGLF